MGVACSSRKVRVSQVLSSSPPCCEEVSPELLEELEELATEDEEEESWERSVKAAAVLISEQVEETLELMLEPGTSFSCEDATVVLGRRCSAKMESTELLGGQTKGAKPSLSRTKAMVTAKT